VINTAEGKFLGANKIVLAL